MNIIVGALRKAATLGRFREVLFFDKDGAEQGAPPNVVEFGKGDLAALQADASRPWSAGLGELVWFDAGGRLFALASEGQHVSFGWAMPAQSFHVGELGGMVTLTEPVLWIWACFTPPEHRGRGHYTDLLRGIRRSHGPARTVIYSLRDNIASRRGIEKAGFDPAFSVVWHRLGVVPWRNARGLLRDFGAA